MGFAQRLIWKNPDLYDKYSLLAWLQGAIYKLITKLRRKKDD